MIVYIPHRAAASLLALCFSCAAGAQALPAGERPYVVKQGTAELDFTDIDAHVARIPADKRAGYMNDPDRIEQALRGLLLVKQMAKEAEDAGIDKDPVVAAEIELAREEILAKRRVAKIVDALEVPSMEALGKERYLTSPALFTTPETLQAYLTGPRFGRNPVGVEFDPDEWLARLRSGTPSCEMLVREADEPVSPIRSAAFETA